MENAKQKRIRLEQVNMNLTEEEADALKTTASLLQRFAEENQEERTTVDVLNDWTYRSESWRSPTREEYKELLEWVDETMGEGMVSLDHHFAIVLENYSSDSPGYTGRIMFIVFGYPEAHLVMGWNTDGEIFRMESVNDGIDAR